VRESTAREAVRRTGRCGYAYQPQHQRVERLEEHERDAVFDEQDARETLLWSENQQSRRRRSWFGDQRKDERPDQRLEHGRQERAGRHILDSDAEGALTEVHSILQRMRELAVQAASDTNTNVDRNQIQAELDQLREEIDRIAERPSSTR